MERMLFLPIPPQTATSLVETVTIAPSDDVWVYPHASDPGRDETVRIWGTGGRAVAADPVDAEEFAYGYLRFSLPAHVRNARIVGATLELTNVVNDDLGEDDGAANPLEVRPLVGTFDEKSWNYSDVAKVHPDPKTVWGRGAPKIAKGEPLKFSIDLLAPAKDAAGKPSAGPSEFVKALNLAFPASGGLGDLRLGLTSTVDAQIVGMRRIYKIYTKETSDETRRPRLVLKLGETG